MKVLRTAGSWSLLAGVVALVARTAGVGWLISYPIRIDRSRHITRLYREGDVVEVDSRAGEIVILAGVGTRMHPVPIRVDAWTAIQYQGSPLALGEIRRGDHATVRFVSPVRAGAGEGTAIAREIRLARAAGLQSY